MTFSVVLINGGDFSNIDAPLEIEANSFEQLTTQVKSNFGLDQTEDQKVDLIVTYCGVPITQLPRPGAPLFVSVKATLTSAFAHHSSGDVNYRKEVGEALEYIRHNTDRRRPPGHREKILSVIKNVIERRWKKYPQLCAADLHGANLCSSLERFVKCLDPKIIRKHEIIVQMVLDIHRIAQQKMLNTVQAKPAGTNQAAPSAQNFINAALGQGGQSSQSTNQSGITQDMLTQALQSVQATMQATGQSPAQLDGANQNLAQAAQGVVSEIAALAQAVDRGINQLREMGILDLTTEAEARRILQDNGGNVEAAINTILQ